MAKICTYHLALAEYENESFVSAFYLFEKGMGEMDLRCQFFCALFLDQGFHGTTEKEKAKSIMVNLAPRIDQMVDQKDPEFTFLLAESYRLGMDVEKNIMKYIELLKFSSHLGSVYARFRLAKEYYLGEHIEKNPKLAFEMMNECLSFPVAPYWVAKFYENGVGIEKDITKALYWYEQGAKRNNSLAQNALGFSYEYGDIVEKDYQKAFYWYSLAAKNNYPHSQLALGYSYEVGDIVDKDYSKAMFWYQEAAKNNYVDAFYRLGYHYEFGTLGKKNKSKALYWYTKGAHSHDPIAQYALGICYEQGLIVPKDYLKAMEWYTIAANHNYVEAQYALGYAYDQGILIPKDKEKALYWYQTAAKNGSINAHYALGISYEFGNLTPKNPQKALECYLSAAHLNNHDAQYALGYAYEHGTIVVIDYTQALEWYLKAADANDALAHYALAISYESGEWLPQDDAKAYYYYEQAANYNNAEAQHILGIAYKRGEKVGKDLKKSFYWTQRAAENNHINAQLILAKDYLMGEGVERNILEAYSWLNKAAHNGNTEALYQLGRLYTEEFDQPNYSLGLHYFQKAAKKGHPQANYQCGMAYWTGKAGVIDYKKSRYYLLQAKKLGENTDIFLDIIQRLIAPQKGDKAMETYAKNLGKINNYNQLSARVNNDLQKDFGSEWDHLQLESKIYLNTGMITYIHLKRHEHSSYKNDYSSVIVPFTKALESELNLYINLFYIRYLHDHQVSPLEFTNRQRMNLFQINKEETRLFTLQEANQNFTLGSVGYLMGIRSEQKLSLKVLKEQFHLKNTAGNPLDRIKPHSTPSGLVMNKPSIRTGSLFANFNDEGEYEISVNPHFINYLHLLFKVDAFSIENREQEMIAYLLEFHHQIDDITKAFRNKAAHRDLLDHIAAETCASWIVKTKKILFYFLSKIKDEYLLNHPYSEYWETKK